MEKIKLKVRAFIEVIIDTDTMDEETRESFGFDPKNKTDIEALSEYAKTTLCDDIGAFIHSDALYNSIIIEIS